MTSVFGPHSKEMDFLSNNHDFISVEAKQVFSTKGRRNMWLQGTMTQSAKTNPQWLLLFFSR